MLAAGVLALAIGLALAGYYLKIHLEWRAEVRRRRAARERQRDFYERLYPARRQL